jgi:hypothetical protein
MPTCQTSGNPKYAGFRIGGKRGKTTERKTFRLPVSPSLGQPLAALTSPLSPPLLPKMQPRSFLVAFVLTIAKRLANNLSMAKRITTEEIDSIATCVLNRMDSKGETIEEAIEAVTGGPAAGALAKKIKRQLGSK